MEDEDQFKLPPIRCLTCNKVLADKQERFDQYVEEFMKTGMKRGAAEAAANNKLGLVRYCCRQRMMESNIMSFGAPPKQVHVLQSDLEDGEKWSSIGLREPRVISKAGIQKGSDKTGTERKREMVVLDEGVRSVGMDISDERDTNYLRLRERVKKVEVKDIIEEEEPVKMRAVGEGYYVRVLTGIAYQG